MTVIEAENALEELSKCWWKWKANSDDKPGKFHDEKVLIKKGIAKHMSGKLKSKRMKRKTFPKWKLNQILPLRDHRHSTSSGQKNISDWLRTQKPRWNTKEKSELLSAALRDGKPEHHLNIYGFIQNLETKCAKYKFETWFQFSTLEFSARF